MVGHSTLHNQENSSPNARDCDNERITSASRAIEFRCRDDALRDIFGRVP